MSDFISTLPYRRPRRSSIDVGSDTLKPRRLFATEDLGVSDKTASRMDLPSTVVGGVVHVLVNASRKVIADRAHQRRKPKGRRGA
jgi:hypothetical protein